MIVIRKKNTKLNYVHLKRKQFVPSDFDVGEVIVLWTNEKWESFEIERIHGLNLTLKAKDSKTFVIYLDETFNLLIKKISFYLGISWDRCNHRWRAQIPIHGKQRGLPTHQGESQDSVAKRLRETVNELKTKEEIIKVNYGTRLNGDVVQTAVEKLNKSKRKPRPRSKKNKIISKVKRKRNRSKNKKKKETRKKQKTGSKKLKTEINLGQEAEKNLQLHTPQNKALVRKKIDIGGKVQACSKFKGVHYHPNFDKYMAATHIDGDLYTNGRWPTVQEAAEKADETQRLCNENYTSNDLNFPTQEEIDSFLEQFSSEGDDFFSSTEDNQNSRNSPRLQNNARKINNTNENKNESINTTKTNTKSKSNNDEIQMSKDSPVLIGLHDGSTSSSENRSQIRFSSTSSPSDFLKEKVSDSHVGRIQVRNNASCATNIRKSRLQSSTSEMSSVSVDSLVPFVFKGKLTKPIYPVKSMSIHISPKTKQIDNQSKLHNSSKSKQIDNQSRSHNSSKSKQKKNDKTKKSFPKIEIITHPELKKNKNRKRKLILEEMEHSEFSSQELQKEAKRRRKFLNSEDGTSEISSLYEIDDDGDKEKIKSSFYEIDDDGDIDKEKNEETSMIKISDSNSGDDEIPFSVLFSNKCMG